jgi:hypothetical protein
VYVSGGPIDRLALTSRAESSPTFESTIESGTLASPGCAFEGLSGLLPQYTELTTTFATPMAFTEGIVLSIEVTSIRINIKLPDMSFQVFIEITGHFSVVYI